MSHPHLTCVILYCFFLLTSSRNRSTGSECLTRTNWDGWSHNILTTRKCSLCALRPLVSHPLTGETGGWHAKYWRSLSWSEKREIMGNWESQIVHRVEGDEWKCDGRSGHPHWEMALGYAIYASILWEAIYSLFMEFFVGDARIAWRAHLDYCFITSWLLMVFLLRANIKHNDIIHFTAYGSRQ